MILNQSVAVSTSKVMLVPYEEHHVPIYHEWMKDPALQNATASEPLTLEEEYEMQRKWRQDADKLTFIICLPDDSVKDVRNGQLDSKAMIGDVNLFIHLDQNEWDTPRVIGELELMIAYSHEQRKGYGRSAILSMLTYVLGRETRILQEFQRSKDLKARLDIFSHFAVKISANNSRSIALFEGLDFVKTSKEPNYFDEFEMKHEKFTREDIRNLMAQHQIQDYKEIEYVPK